jgi:hypothetical protein
VNISKKLIALFLLLFLVQVSFSQSITPNSGDIFEETSDVPIDGAIALLTIAGLGIGVKKLYNKNGK